MVIQRYKNKTDERKLLHILKNVVSSLDSMQLQRHLRGTVSRMNIVWEDLNTIIYRSQGWFYNMILQSAKKLTGILFKDANGCAARGFRSHGQTINVDRYCKTMDRMKEAVRWKSQMRFIRVPPCCMTTIHRSELTKEWILPNDWNVLPHQLHSLVFVSTDHLFVSLKRHYSRKRSHAEICCCCKCGSVAWYRVFWEKCPCALKPME